MYKLTIIIVLFCLSIKAFPQILTVKDAESGDVIEAVSISSQHPKAFIITNAKGQCDISAFKGSETIEIRHFGYKVLTTSYTELSVKNLVADLEPTALKIEEIVVSATRWNQRSSDIPVKISSVTTKSINLQSPQTAADMLAISGKVFIQKSQQGGGSPMIRGFATNRLLYSVDGIRMNTAIFRSGNIQNVISLDPFAIEKTEIFFGPGSVIYGSDAIGGVMSFQTLQAKLSNNNNPYISGKAVARYSSANNENSFHFDINTGWKKWALLSSFSSYTFGDLKMGSIGPEEYLRPFYVQRQNNSDVVIINDNPRIQRPSGYTQNNIMQKVRFSPNGNWDFSYGFHYSETSDYARYDRHIRYKNGQPRYGEWSYGPQIWMMNNLNIMHRNNNLLYNQMTLRLAQQYFEESRIDRNINKNERHIRTEKVDAYSFNLDFKKSLTENNTLFYGIEWIFNDVESTGINEDISNGLKSTGPSRYPQSIWKSAAIYLTDQWHLNEKLLLQTGLRYNLYQLDAHFDTSFYPFPFTMANINNGSVTGSAGIVFRPNDKWLISTNLATAFRSPNVDDMGKVFDSEPGKVIVPNPDLEAEYAYNADFELAKIFGNFLKIDFSAYYTYINNALVRRDAQLNGLDSIMYNGEKSKVQSVQNAANATVYGIQTGVELIFNSGFGFSTDFNYQRGEEELDNGNLSPSRHAPPMFGTSSINYSTNKLSMKLYAVYSGKKDFDDLAEEEKGKTEIYAIDENGNPWSPAWYTLNYKAMYQLNQMFTLSAGVENITNQRYRTYSSGICGAGRNLTFSVFARF